MRLLSYIALRQLKDGPKQHENDDGILWRKNLEKRLYI